MPAFPIRHRCPGALRCAVGPRFRGSSSLGSRGGSPSGSGGWRFAKCSLDGVVPAGPSLHRCGLSCCVAASLPSLRRKSWPGSRGSSPFDVADRRLENAGVVGPASGVLRLRRRCLGALRRAAGPVPELKPPTRFPWKLTLLPKERVLQGRVDDDMAFGSASVASPLSRPVSARRRARSVAVSPTRFPWKLTFRRRRLPAQAEGLLHHACLLPAAP